MAVESLKRIFQVGTVKEGREGRDVVVSPRSKKKSKTKPGKEEGSGTPGHLDIKV